MDGKSGEAPMIEMCIGCGRPILVHKIANLTVKCEPTPLTDVGDIVRLLTSPNPPSLWMVERNRQGQPVRLRGARPGEAGPVPEHRCLKAQEALSRPRTPSVVPTPQSTPPVPSADRTAPSSGPSTAPSSVRPAAAPRSSHPCDRCRRPVEIGGPELYCAVQLGATVVWVQHEACTAP